MAIPKKDDSQDRSIKVMVLGLLLLFVCSANSLGEEGPPYGLLEGSSAVDTSVLPADVKADINELEEMLKTGEDMGLRSRLAYRIGVLHFKNQAFSQARLYLSAVDADAECGGAVRACALNMLGQTSRLQADVPGALEAFGRLTDLLQGMNISNSDSSFAWTLRLLSSAIISRAELFQLQNDIPRAIKAYASLTEWLDSHSANPLCLPYLALALDRESQLNLQQGNVAEYLDIAGAIARRCPQYHRTGIIQWEIECVSLLKRSFADIDFTNGSIMAPALIIERLDRFSDKEAIDHIIKTTGQLCIKYQGSYSGLILQYHYAWLLDRAGRSEQALEQFSGLSNITIRTVSMDPLHEHVISTLQGYAGIQQAMMMGEKGEYRKGLQIINAVKHENEGTHSKKLKESVSNCLEILNREVPSNARN